MSISDGQNVNASVTNAAFMSRLVDTSTIGVVGLSNVTNGDSGAGVTNLQRAINETFDAVGMTGEGDATRNDYSSNNVVTDGDDRKVAIGKLDGEFDTSTGHTHDGADSNNVAAVNVSNTPSGDIAATNVQSAIDELDTEKVSKPGTTVDNTVARYDGVTGDIQESGVTISDTDDVVIPGDLTVNGTTTTINTATLDVVDENITANFGGNDATSEGAGLTIDRTGTSGSFVYEDALASKFKIGALASEVEVATVSGAQVVTNKDIDGGTAANTRRITLPSDTRANLDALDRKAGTLVYATDDSDFLGDNGSTLEDLGGGGSGQGGINHIASTGGENPDFETDTTGYVPYADAADTDPVDGTAGSPTVVINRTVSVGEVQRGTGSGEIVKDAADRQGEGVSYDFDIDPADQSSQQTISFDYDASVLFAFNGGTAGDESDLMVWIYDVTNAALIQPAPFGLDGSGQFVAQFQAAPDSTSYRLIWHVATTNAGAWDFFFDNVSVGPSAVTKGAPVSDWVSYTPTISGFGTETNVDFKFRRVGDSIDIEGEFTAGTVAASEAQVSLPSLAVASSVAALTVSGHYFKGQNTTAHGGALLITPGDTFINFSTSNVFSGTSAIGKASANGDAVTASSEVIGLKAYGIKIEGWASNVILSDDASTRVVAAMILDTTPTGTIAATAASSTDVVFDTKIFDTHNAYNVSNGEYTVPVSGHYEISGQVHVAATEANNDGHTAQLFIDAVNDTANSGRMLARVMNTALASVPLGFKFLRQLNAGQVVDLRITSNSTTPIFGGQTNGHYIQFQRLTGPAQIAASETVSAIWEDQSGTSYTTAVPQVIDSETVIKDTHALLSVGVYTCPSPGFYKMDASVRWTNSAVWANGESASIDALQNGTRIAQQNNVMHASPGATFVMENQISTLAFCDAGDTLSFELNQVSGSALTLQSGAGFVRCSVIRY